jgi:4'-phosphopantetheinyl transferase EntD
MSFSDILPFEVQVAEGWIDDFQTPLPPNEQQSIGAVVVKRQREFIAGRNCAKRALKRLGVRCPTVGSGSRRQPIWPDGIVGSISHADTYCAAAVCRASDYAGLGIDIELNTILNDELARLICTEAERENYRNNWTADIDPLKLLFSAKESIFKTVFPILATDPGFLNIEVEIDFELRGFRVHGPSNPNTDLKCLLSIIQGAFDLSSQHVLTAAWISASDFSLNERLSARV